MRPPSSQQICIHQFHYSTGAGDAVTNQMLFIREALREAGVSGDIFAIENKADASFGIRRFSPNFLWNADLILIHHSHGNPALHSLLRVEIPKALIYHNITPTRFFAHDPYMAHLCDLGRRQLKAFRGVVTASFAVSRYNARELDVLGFSETKTFPLFELAGPAKSARKKGRTKGPLDLIFVGKQTPHKNQALLIQTLSYLESNSPGKYRLVLAGRKDPIYGAYLRLLVRVLRLEKRVVFTGRMPQAELDDLYRNAAAFISTSRHEGFGIPLVEAMRSGIPVFALPITGVRETLGNAGIRLKTRKPHRIAEIIDAVLSRTTWIEPVLKGQRARVEALRTVQNKTLVQELCLDLIHDLRHPLRPKDVPTEREIHER